MRETCLSISRRIFRPHRIAWHVVLICLMSYSLANAQSSTIPLSDNKVEPTVALVTAALVATVIVIAIFSALVVQCCFDRTAATQAWSTAGGQSRLSGLEPAAVEAFPVLVYSAVKQMKIGEASLECAVCLSEFEDDETLRLLPKCNHAFHPACIGMWLASHVTCPVCRANLTPESADISKDSTPQATTEPNQQNSAAQCNEIAITINEEQNRDSQSSASQQSNLPQRTGVLEKLTRSHSTGHSLGLLGEEYTERYTLRLPDEVRRQLMWRAELTRARSFDVFSAREWSSRRGYRIGGGGGGERIGRSDRWVFSLTPPFVSRGGDHAGDSVNGRKLLASVRGSLNCLEP